MWTRSILSLYREQPSRARPSSGRAVSSSCLTKADAYGLAQNILAHYSFVFASLQA